MKSVMAYQTSDGRLFESVAEAEIHEETGILFVLINQFEKKFDGRVFKTKELIIEWENFRKHEVIETPIDHLSIDARTKTALKSEGYLYVKDIIGKRRNDFLKIPNVGKKSLSEIEGVLRMFGFEIKE